MMKKTLLLTKMLVAAQFLAAQNTILLKPGTEGKDAVVFSRTDAVNTNNGNLVYLAADTWTWNADGLGQGSMRSLIEFDLTSLPSNVSILSAKLVLKYSNGIVDGHEGANAATLYRNTAAWQEGTLTWNNKPALSASGIAVPASTNKYQNYEIDVTADVADMYDNQASNFGWTLKLNTESPYAGLFFASSDHAKTDLHPELLITYGVCGQYKAVLQPSKGQGKDAHIGNRTDVVNKNDGNSVQSGAYAWTWNGDGLGAGTYRSLLAFDLSALPSDAVVSSSVLTLYANNGIEGTGHSNLSHSNASKLYRITEKWDELGVTWANQPAINSVASGVLAQNTTAFQNYSIDLTNDVADMVTNPSANNGWLLKMDNENYYAGLFFHSSDNADALKAPKLEISYKSCVVKPRCLDGTVVYQPTKEGKDATIFSRKDQQNVNMGDDVQMENATWTWDNDGLGQGTLRSLIEFNLSGLPAGASISSANLYLTGSLVFTQGHSNLTHSNASKMYRISNAWDESTVTWSNQPAISANASAVLATSTSATQNYVLDLKTDVQDFYNNPAINHGWMIKMDAESPYASLFFHSSDAANASVAPKLEIAYTCPVVTDVNDQYLVVNELVAFPNPTKDGKITLNKISSGVVYAASGKSVMNFSAVDTLDLSNLTNGLYVVKTTEGTALKVEKK